MEPALQMLLAKDEIQTALNSYALGMDLRRPDRFLSAWHDDGFWWMNSAMGGEDLVANGHDEMLDALAALWGEQQAVVHLIGNQQITVDDEDHAHGESHAAVIGVTVRGNAFICGVVYPDDRFERRGGEWKLSQRRVEVNSFAEVKPEAADVELFAGFGGAFPVNPSP